MVMETSESKLLSPVNLGTLATMMLQRPGVALSDIQAAICQHAERDNLSVDMPLTGLLLQSLHRYEIAIAPELRRLVCGAIVDDPTGQLAYLSVMEYLHRLGDRPDQLAIPRPCNSSVTVTLILAFVCMYVDLTLRRVQSFQMRKATVMNLVIPILLFYVVSDQFVRDGSVVE